MMLSDDVDPQLASLEGNVGLEKATRDSEALHRIYSRRIRGVALPAQIRRGGRRSICRADQEIRCLSVTAQAVSHDTDRPIPPSLDVLRRWFFLLAFNDKRPVVLPQLRRSEASRREIGRLLGEIAELLVFVLQMSWTSDNSPPQPAYRQLRAR